MPGLAVKPAHIVSEAVTTVEHVDAVNPNDSAPDDSKDAFVLISADKPTKPGKKDKDKDKKSKRNPLSDRRPGDPFMDDPKETDVIVPLVQEPSISSFYIAEMLLQVSWVSPEWAKAAYVDLIPLKSITHFFSQFINTLLGEADVACVGHSLNSQTNQIQHVVYPHPFQPGHRVIVIDTPGFDHTTVDDREILRRIAVWLAQSYDAQMKLAGIVYLHEISQGNMPPVQRNIDMFSKLCGSSAIKNVVLATTKWSDIPPDLGEQREKILKDHYWKAMLERGSIMHRYEGTQDSARAIVDQILAQDPLDAVQIQMELIDLNKVLAETEAGRSLYYCLSELLEEQKNAQRGGDPDLRRLVLETDLKIRSILYQLKRLNYPPLSKRIKNWLGVIAWNGSPTVCGSDLHAYLSRIPIYADSTPNEVTGEAAPVTLGHEFVFACLITHGSASNGSLRFSGTIIEVGPEVDESKWSIGTNVVVVSVDGEEAWLKLSQSTYSTCMYFLKAFHSDATVTAVEIGACIEPLAVAWHAIKRSGFAAGKSVLVLGAGPIGLFLLKILRSFDPSSVITVSEPTLLRREQALKHGATFAVDPLNVDIPQFILKATSGKGVDVVFDAAGVQVTMDAALKSVRPRGTIVNVAVWEKPAIVDFNLVWMKEINLTGSSCYDRVHAELLEAVGSGRLTGLEDLITKKIALTHVIEEGFNTLLHNRDEHAQARYKFPHNAAIHEVEREIRNK
ncbi:hypothetical protein H0H93_016308 [Arthromyces matolae]|nr:hypothetical protein H0H93_016308 [Arthromyces matolae]